MESLKNIQIQSQVEVLISVVSICSTISRYPYLVYEGLSMKMDCVDINLVPHSQKVPAHLLSLVHGQPRQGGIEPAIDCCARGNTERERLLAVSEIVRMLQLHRGKAANQRLQSSYSTQCNSSQCPPQDSPPSSAIYPLLTARTSDLPSRPCCSSTQMNLKNYLC